MKTKNMNPNFASFTVVSNLPGSQGRWVMAPLCGVWMTAWLQRVESNGAWVSFCAEAPFRFVPEFRETA